MIETVISVFGLICAITLFVFRMIEEKSVDNRKTVPLIQIKMIENNTMQ